MTPAPFEVQTEELEGGIRSVTVLGELDMNTAAELEQRIQDVPNGDALVLLDLTGCEFIDSTGIALIVRTWQRLDREGGGKGRGRLVLCCNNTQVRRLLEITGVESSISLHSRRDAALGELRS